MSITLYAKLDMTPGAVPTVVHRSQYDSDFTLVFSLYTRTGDFVIASGTTARMRGTKTTGTGYSVPVTLNVSAKTVTVTGDQQMTAAAGSNIFEIVLYQGDLEICSSNFVLAVERAAMDMDTITDETVVPELERLNEYIEQAAEVAAYAESWAVGGTGKREGENTNNAKYWAEQASGVVHGVTLADYYKVFPTDTASGAIAHFTDGADSIPMKDVLVHIEPVQAGSGDPSPENVRAISGWTAANVTRAGKNLLPYPYAETTKEVNGITFTDNGDGTITANGTATASAQFVLTRSMPNKDYIGCILNGRQGTVANSTRICAQVYREPWTMFANDYGSGVTITDSGYEQIRFIIVVDNGKTCNNLVFRPMLRAPSDTDATYTPFVKKDVYNITFPSSAGTVYGGTLDVTTGELVVDRKMLVADGSTIKFSFASSNNTVAEYKNAVFGFVSADALQSASANIVPNIISDTYTAISYNTALSKTAESYGVTIVDSGVTATMRVRVAIPKSQNIITVEEANTWLENNPLQIVYPLATPQTYQLTPQEITSLLGENNVWADTGDSEVEYRADTKMYIARQIADAVSALS